MKKPIYLNIAEDIKKNFFNLTGKKSPTSISGVMNCLFFF